MNFDTFSKLAPKGSQIVVFLKNDPGTGESLNNEIVGIVQSCDKTRVILQTQDGLLERIGISAIVRIKVLSQKTSDTEQSLQNEIKDIIPDNLEQAEPLYDIEYIKAYFSGKPHLEFPKPEFNYKISNKANILNLIDRCKYKFEDYVENQHDNIIQKVKLRSWFEGVEDEIKRIYLTIKSNNVRGYFSYLSGVFAHFSAFSEAPQYYLKESFYKYSFMPSAYPLAVLLIKESNYEKACSFLAIAIKHRNESNCNDLIRTLGQCVMQLKANVLVPIGSILEVKDLPQETAELAWMLIYYLLKDLLKDNPDAYTAIKNKDVELLRKCKIGKDIFPRELENKLIEQEEDDEDEVEDIDVGDFLGKIIYYNYNGNSGFLREAETGQKWRFEDNNILDKSLLQSLKEGTLNQWVTFNVENNNSYSQYPIACSIHLCSSKADYSTISFETDYSDAFIEKLPPSPLEARLRSLPKNSSYYAKAKEAEQIGDLLGAQRFYQLELFKGNHSNYFNSAVKDLATLLNRMNKPLEAIALLDKYARLLPSTETPAINKMKATFFIKAKEYKKAAQLFVDLANGLSLDRLGEREKKVSYLQQEAYCYYAMQDYDAAIKKLKSLAGWSHNENVSMFLEKVKQTKETEESPDQNELDYILEDNLSKLAVLKLGDCTLEELSQITGKKYNGWGSCEYRDLETVKHMLNSLLPLYTYPTGNIWLPNQNLRNTLTNIYLTAAKLCFIFGEPNSKTNFLLFNYFLLMAEGSLNDNLDVARCYAIEALRIGDSEYKVQKAWTTLLLTYNSEDEYKSETDVPSPSHFMYRYYIYHAEYLIHPSLYKNYNDNPLSKEVHFLFNHKESRDAFLRDYPYIYKKTHRVIPQLREFVEKEGFTLPVPLNDNQINSPRHRVEKLFSLFDNFDRLDSSRIDRIQNDFLHEEHNIATLSDLDQTRIRELIELLFEISHYKRSYTDFNSLFLHNKYIESKLISSIEDCQNRPTSLSIEKIYDVYTLLLVLLKNDLNERLNQKPDLQLSSVLNFYSIEQDGKISVKLELESKDRNSPPIKNIHFYIDGEDRDYDDICYLEPFGYGKQEFEFRFLPTEQEKAEKRFSLQLSLQYRSITNKIETVGPFSLSINLEPPMTEEIVNPYKKYSGGNPVNAGDFKMFFGRDDLVKTICDALSEHYSGQCFVVYGQKRSGKTSILNQVGAKLKTKESQNIYTSISAGSFNFDSKKILNSFVLNLLLKLKGNLKKDYNLDFPIEIPKNIDSFDPFILLNQSKDFLSDNGYGWIVAVDEFTYIYSDEKEDIERFMHAWKSMLESKLFNALIIGQDTMPAFKKEFPNDFGVTHDVRITYLDRESVYRMASEPILLENGESRFKGDALKKVYDLTAGNPYFLQQMCSLIVDYLNKKKSPYVTGSDIDNVLDGMIRRNGNNYLEADRFDSILTAGDKKMAKFPEGDLENFLVAIAKSSYSSPDGWCSIESLSSYPQYKEMIEDLVSRDSLIREYGLVKIRVGLYSHWLRINK